MFRRNITNFILTTTFLWLLIVQINPVLGAESTEIERFTGTIPADEIESETHYLDADFTEKRSNGEYVYLSGNVSYTIWIDEEYLAFACVEIHVGSIDESIMFEDDCSLNGQGVLETYGYIDTSLRLDDSDRSDQMFVFINKTHDVSVNYEIEVILNPIRDDTNASYPLIGLIGLGVLVLLRKKYVNYNK